MTVDINILAQYYENYNVDGGAPYWKPKGAAHFQILNVDSDSVIYAEDLESALRDLVAKESNTMARYEYIEHEVLFHKPNQIQASDLEEILTKQWQEA